MTAARTIALTVTEAQLQDQVLLLAKWTGWASYHPYDSRRSTPGYPDLTLVRGKRLVFAEMKSEKGRISLDQRRWLGWLDDAGVEVYLWRPSDWKDIETALTSRSRPNLASAWANIRTPVVVS